MPQLTMDGSPTIVNGTSDWVSEEELGIRDGFRWSPDGKSIAFWQFDSSGVEPFTLINDTDGLYPTVTRIPYPKAGTHQFRRAHRRRGRRGRSDPMDADARRPAQHLPDVGLQWTARLTALLIQQLNRLQNTNDLLAADVRTGDVRARASRAGTAWVEVVEDLVVDRWRTRRYLD